MAQHTVVVTYTSPEKYEPDDSLWVAYDLADSLMCEPNEVKMIQVDLEALKMAADFTQMMLSRHTNLNHEVFTPEQLEWLKKFANGEL